MSQTVTEITMLVGSFQKASKLKQNKMSKAFANSLGTIFVNSETKAAQVNKNRHTLLINNVASDQNIHNFALND